MAMRDRERPLGKQPRIAERQTENSGIIHPACIANAAYKSWQPSVEAQGPAAAPARSLARRERPSWFARFRFSFFHR